MGGVHGIMNIPAVFILLLLSALLIRGTRESAVVNNLIVITKLSIVLLVIVFGWGFINPTNHTPFRVYWLDTVWGTQLAPPSPVARCLDCCMEKQPMSPRLPTHLPR